MRQPRGKTSQSGQPCPAPPCSPLLLPAPLCSSLPCSSLLRSAPPFPALLLPALPCSFLPYFFLPCSFLLFLGDIQLVCSALFLESTVSVPLSQGSTVEREMHSQSHREAGFHVRGP